MGLDTPHVPGPWEAGAVMFEEEERDAVCGDMLSRSGPGEVTTTADIASEPASAHDERMHGNEADPQQRAHVCGAWWP